MTKVLGLFTCYKDVYKRQPKRKEYQNLLNIINEFMELFEA